MNYCEKHKSWYPVCCQACQWEAIMGIHALPANVSKTATEIEERRAEKFASLGIQDSSERQPT